MDTVERHVTLDTGLEEAWELLTRAEDLAGWLGAEVVLDPTAGTTGEVVDHDGARRRLVVDEVEEGRRIAWRWWPEDEPDQHSRVEITLLPTDGGTRVHVIEELVGATPVAEARAGEAWSHRLLHLEALRLVAAAVRG